ncbi:MAG: OmpA family protein [Mariprofundaceae bacterium]|nr:OmpA family protein [Mariprofundaceae bacterium]
MKYVVMISLVLLSACVTNPTDPNRNTKQNASAGAMIGAVVGAVAGYQKDHSGGALRGALIGGAGGAALGAASGVYMDKQKAEFDRQLAAEQQAHEIEVQRLENENLKITMSNEVSFDSNSSQIKPSFEKTLNKVIGIVQRYEKTKMVVVGHTDSIGSFEYNQTLSEQRSAAVGNYMRQHGVPDSRIRTEGRGEREPRANNINEAGRQLNRRVELLITPNS